MQNMYITILLLLLRYALLVYYAYTRTTVIVRYVHVWRQHLR